MALVVIGSVAGLSLMAFASVAALSLMALVVIVVVASASSILAAWWSWVGPRSGLDHCLLVGGCCGLVAGFGSSA